MSESFPADLVSDSPAMEDCLELMRAASESTVPVMFLGEKGTGKRYFARALHALSLRGSRPCVVMPCGDFVEGAVAFRFRGPVEEGGGVVPSILESAGGGSLVLSDLEQMPVGIQKELYLFLSGYDVGVEGGPRLGVRLFSTLRTVVDSGRRVFAEELLNILSETLVRIPPLRERREDISRLAGLFLERSNVELGRDVGRFSAGAMDFLRHYDFPGNVSELRRLVTRAVRWARGGVIYREDFGNDDVGGVGVGAEYDYGSGSLSELECRHVKRVLTRVGWNRRAAARILGITETMLSRKIKLYGFEQES